MAIETPVTAADNVFLGDDRLLRFPVYVPDSDPFDIEEGNAVAEALTEGEDDWTFSWALSLDGVNKIWKTSDDGISIATRDPLVAVVALTAADSVDLDASTKYFHTLRRTDTDVAEVLSFGPFVFREPAAEPEGS